jgi:hypothetical protein
MFDQPFTRKRGKTDQIGERVPQNIALLPTWCGTDSRMEEQEQSP